MINDSAVYMQDKIVSVAERFEGSQCDVNPFAEHDIADESKVDNPAFSFTTVRMSFEIEAKSPWYYGCFFIRDRDKPGEVSSEGVGGENDPVDFRPVQALYVFESVFSFFFGGLWHNIS